ncbi:MAG: sigma 54-interacting transcriptional regulator [Saprospiraceae bacterium]
MKKFDVESNRTLAAMCDASEAGQEGVIWLQKDGQILSINDLLVDELGYTDPNVIPATIFEINPSLSLLAWRKLWKRMLTEPKIILDSEHITADESIYPVKIEGTLIEVEEEMYGMLVSQNLMEANRFKELFEFTSKIAGIGSWEWDLVKNEFFFNDEMYHLLELPAKTEINQNTLEELITKGFSENDLKSYDEKIKAAIQNGTPFELEYSFEINGQYKNFNLHAHPVVLEGETIKIYGTLQNLNNISKRTDDMYFTKYSMDYARDMIYWISEAGIITYVNQTACEKLNYSPDEILGQDIKFIDKDADIDHKEVWKILKEEKSVEFEANHYTKQGEPIPVSITTNYINYRGKEFNCAFVRDFSKKKQIDEIIKMSKATLDNAIDIIFWVNEDGSFKYFNNSFVKRMGYARKEIEEMNVLDFIHNADSHRYKKGWKALKKEKFYNNVHREMITKSGEIFPAEMTISMIKVGGKYFSSTILRDISERKSLSELAVISKHTLDQAVEMIFWTNEDGSLRYFNSAFIEKIGYSHVQIKELRIFDFFENSNLEVFQKGWEKLRDGAKINGLDRELKTKNGQIIPCEMNITMVKFADEEFSVTILRDVTERKRKENEITRQLNEIQYLQEATAAENIALKEKISLESNFGNIITRDPNYKRVLRQVEQVADTDATVLILGETGTGKELLARAIYQLSERADLPMVKVNCGALPENLIESELFGHERGAFTGAHQQKIGKFERADKGTIFLDEIGELPLDLQAKLLRVLQEGEIERVGGTKLLKIDVRIIAATNRNLIDEVGKGTFREDLYYRLNVFPINNIPLRERREDIPVLIKHFAQKYSKKINKEILEISPRSLKKLMAYDFLGNVRELENLVERAVILSRGKVLNFDLSLTKKTNIKSSRFLSMEEMQKKHIIDALERTNGKVSGDLGAAELLKMNGKTLTSRMRKLGINKRDYLKS